MTINGSAITRGMLRDYTESSGSDFMGDIIIGALGIRGYCEGFCVNRNMRLANNHYNLYWSRDGEVYGETFSEDDIMEALKKVKITVERK